MAELRKIIKYGINLEKIKENLVQLVLNLFLHGTKPGFQRWGQLKIISVIPILWLFILFFGLSVTIPFSMVTDNPILSLYKFGMVTDNPK